MRFYVHSVGLNGSRLDIPLRHLNAALFRAIVCRRVFAAQRVASADLLDKARRDAFGIVAADADLSRPEHRALREAVVARYGQTLELAEVG